MGGFNNRGGKAFQYLIKSFHFTDFLRISDFFLIYQSSVQIQVITPFSK